MRPDVLEDIAGVCSSLAAEGYFIRFRGFSAIDMYLGLPLLPYHQAETNADLATLARFAEELRFPGVEIADGAVDTSVGVCYFHCLDGEEEKENHFPFPLLSFGYNWQSRRFQDPLGVYHLLRSLLQKSPREFRKDWVDLKEVSLKAIRSSIDWRSLVMEGALLLSRYDLCDSAGFIQVLGNCPSGPLPGPEIQKTFLSCLLISPWPDRGLDLLKRSGLLGQLWPELDSLDDVDHSKEFHPEGNVWNHTLETFRYRKAGNSGVFDLRLSLGLLLHDIGKPIAASFGHNRFDGHAELGARAAARFLERLEFNSSLVQDIYFLVKNHMLPAALKRLPFARTGEIMASQLFPTLMELYRCDESSSFKGLDGYYENSAAYQTYLRNIKNPYRSADGKKINKSAILHGRI